MVRHLGSQAVKLNDNDVIEIIGIKMGFFAIPVNQTEKSLMPAMLFGVVLWEQAIANCLSGFFRRRADA